MNPSKPRIDDEEWAVHKAVIRNLYLVQEASLAQLVTKLSKRGLQVTKAQVEYKLKQWSFRRNLNAETWRYVDHQLSKRKRQEKESDVVVSGARLKRSKVERETKRNREVSILPWKSGSAPSPRLPEDMPVVICSPPPFRTQLQWPMGMPWLQFNHRAQSFSSLLQPFRRKSVDIFEEWQFSTMAAIAEAHKNKSITQCAAVISTHIPETYEDENLARAEILLSGSKEAKFEELFKGLLFQFSNNIEASSYDQPWDLFTAAVSKIGVANLPVLDIPAILDRTVLSFLEKVFQNAVHSADGAYSLEQGYDDDDESYEANNTEDLASDLLRWLARCGYNLNSPFISSSREPSATALQWAVLEGDKELVGLLIDCGAEVDACSERLPLTPIQIAMGDKMGFECYISRNSETTIPLLLSAGAGRDPDRSGYILHSAIKRGRTDVLQALREHGTNFGFRLPRAAGMIAETTALTSAAEFDASTGGYWPSGQRITAMSLFNLGLESMTPYQRDAALSRPGEVSGPGDSLTDLAILAAGSGNDDLIQHLISLGLDLTASNVLGITPLQSAVARRQVRTCQLLLSLGSSTTDRSALHISALTGDINLLICLVQGGFDVNILTQESSLSTILHYLRFKLDQCQFVSPVTRFLRPFSTSTALQILLKLPPRDPTLSRDNCVVYLLQAGARLHGGELVYATRNGRVNLVQAAIQAGADLNEKHSSGLTCLQDAIQSGRRDIAIALLNAGAKLAGGEVGLAIKADDWILATELAARGAEIQEACPTGETILEAALRGGNLTTINWVWDHCQCDYDSGALCGAAQHAVETSDTGFLERLLDRRPSDCDSDVLEGTAVAIAANRRQNPNVLQMLLACLPCSNLCYFPISANFHRRGFWREAGLPTTSPLVGAMYSTGKEHISLLLTAGYLPDHRCLEWAVSFGGVHIVKTLLESGPITCNRDRDTSRLVRLAAMNGDLEMVRFLIQNGQDVNEFGYCGNMGEFRDDPRVADALQAAARDGNLELVNLLLDAGANANGKPYRKAGATALQSAAIWGHLIVAKVLLEHDVPARVDACRAPILGRTALEGAAEQGRLDIVALLLSHGAKTTGTGHRQFLRAIKMAEFEGHHVVVSLLKNHRPWTEEDERRLREDRYLLDDGVLDSERSDSEGEDSECSDSEGEDSECSDSEGEDSEDLSFWE